MRCGRVSVQRSEACVFLELSPEADAGACHPGRVHLGGLGPELADGAGSHLRPPRAQERTRLLVTGTDANGRRELPHSRGIPTGGSILGLWNATVAEVSADSASDGTLRFLAMLAMLFERGHRWRLLF